MMKCTTKACGKLVTQVSSWTKNEYCSFSLATCEHCLQDYWIVDRDGKLSLKDRFPQEEFEHRKSR